MHESYCKVVKLCRLKRPLVLRFLNFKTTDVCSIQLRNAKRKWETKRLSTNGCNKAEQKYSRIRHNNFCRDGQSSYRLTLSQSSNIFYNFDANVPGTGQPVLEISRLFCKFWKPEYWKLFVFCLVRQQSNCTQFVEFRRIMTHRRENFAL